MIYYPVFIPTLNRYTHFRNCVESLVCCTHAEKTELVIGLDYPPHEKYVEGYEKIKAYIPTIKGFSKITVFEHEKNLGPGGNWQFLVDYCKAHYDAYIASEDDCVFSPAFLDYMNNALERCRDDENIVTVSGYNFESAYDQGEFTCYLSFDNCAWGTGYWVHKELMLKLVLQDKNYIKSAIRKKKSAERIINTYPALYLMLNSMISQKEKWGDVIRTTINILEGKYQLKPNISLVRNCGYDGSGIHCGSEDEYQLCQQPISDSKTFVFGKGIGPADTECNKNALFNKLLPSDLDYRNRSLRYINSLYIENTNKLVRIKKMICQIKAKIAIRTRLRRILKILGM